MLSVSFERLTALTQITKTRKSKKKSSSNKVADNSNTNESNTHNNTATKTDKDRLTLLTNILKTLKSTLSDVDVALDTWQTPVVSKTLSESLASMSLNPKVEDLVNGTFREDHKYTVKELKMIVKDKIKLINKV